jgi:hypothetical protein
MSEKPQRLNEVLDTFAPQGSNDRRWFFVEHQLEQVVVSARSVVGSLETIEMRPENDEERWAADACLCYMKVMLRHILDAKAAFLSYLSDTDVPERIGRKEL